MEYSTNNDDISTDGISTDPVPISETDSVRTNTTQLSFGKHKGARCKYCTVSWTRRRAQDMKAYLKMKCKGKDLQNEDKLMPPGTFTLKKRKSDNIMLSFEDYYNTKEAIDKNKEKMANKSLIKWIVYSGILFSAFDNLYFEDYTKMLNPGYSPPKRTTLATSILDIEAANITLKIEKELSKSRNLILCVDGWCSPMKHSIYAFVIMTDKKKQYVYSLRDFSKYSYIAKFNAEKIIEVLENVRPEKFVAIVSDAESAMTVAKRQVAAKYPHILPIRCIAHHIQLISSSICHLPHARNVLSNCQKIVSFFRNSYIASAALRKEIICSFMQQFGGGRISADLLKTQMNLYKNQKYSFKDKFIVSADTITNWWISRDFKRNEDHIKSLAEKVHSISPHNAAYEHVFSILGWYFEKRRTKLSIERLEIMAQMHSYLVENTKSELNYVNPNFPQEDFLSIFNKITSFIKDDTDLFGKEESISFSKELAKELMEELMEEDMESLSDEPDDLDQESSTNLNLENFINLQLKLDIDESLNVNKEIIHGDKNFDVNNLLY
ncbi:17250_t:CDS:2 [Dentiscutata erythropus]|uniref:17250_t:CDS:1 n=1 Tax=Dentiscutata erythropus TaxID=1348616 RepID=A0A9N9BFX6_9GLOM|nr:17250_t:CDS:2 [Dentiscutata erythropus]